MNEAILGLSLAYVALAALLAGLVVLSHWPLWIRAGCVVLVTGFYFVTYISLNGMLGWPTRDLLPKRFLLVASSVREPDKTSGDDGLIHVWVTSLDGDRPAAEPRAFELPYSAELHGQLEDALKNQRKGNVQIGTAIAVDGSGREIPTDTSQLARQTQRIEIGDLPDPRLPEK